MEISREICLLSASSSRPWLVCGRTRDLSHCCCVSFSNTGVLTGRGEPVWGMLQASWIPEGWHWPSSTVVAAECHWPPWFKPGKLPLALGGVSMLSACPRRLPSALRWNNFLKACWRGHHGMAERRFLPCCRPFPYFQSWLLWVPKLGTLVQTGYQKGNRLCASVSMLRWDADGPEWCCFACGVGFWASRQVEPGLKSRTRVCSGCLSLAAPCSTAVLSVCDLRSPLRAWPVQLIRAYLSAET